MTAIDTEDPADRDAGKQTTTEQPEPGVRQGGDLAEAGNAQGAEREDPFALDPLGPPSGRPW
jgi:hypothetical protein